MTPEEHNKTLATLHFVYGGVHGLTLLALALLILVVELSTPVAGSLSAFWVVVAAAIFVVLLVAVGLLPLIVGYGLARRRSWARSAALILAVISLINVPIGTALGIYTFRFFRGDAGAQLYGGSAGKANEAALQNALRSARPLVNWADKLK
jgi:hypothetical protein